MEARAILLGFLVFVMVQQTIAQHDEICDWQCDVAHCNFFSHYCDYDCYEDCYDASPTLPTSLPPCRPVRPSHPSRPTDLLHPATVSGLRDSSRSGKAVRLRIENPTVQGNQRGNVVYTRRLPPKGFALMQTCLSSRVKERQRI